MVVKTEDFDFYNTLLVEKSHENILVYDVLYKTLTFHIIFNKVNGFIRYYNGTKYSSF